MLFRICIADDIGHTSGEVNDGPMLICYDQEPILTPYNFELFDYIQQNCQAPFILLTTECDSDPLNLIKYKYKWPTAYYFHHAFVAHDWYRGYRYDARLQDPQQRKLVKKYITFNRLTSNARVYRSIFIGSLVQHNLLEHGYVSYSETCPDGGHYRENLSQAVDNKIIRPEQAKSTISYLDQLQEPLRIDFQNAIPNGSFLLSAIEQSQQSFCQVVTETCYWERKCHLTEKIFKPIVSRMPFILLGPAHNLRYLRSYGFKTRSEEHTSELQSH